MLSKGVAVKDASSDASFCYTAEKSKTVIADKLSALLELQGNFRFVVPQSDHRLQLLRIILTAAIRSAALIFLFFFSM